jgi:PhoPQ-activated pathogenicity-related protein
MGCVNPLRRALSHRYAGFMKMCRNLFLSLTCAFIAAVGAAQTPAAAEKPLAGALAEYVARPDDSFGWTERSSGFLGHTHYTEYVMISQNWRGITWKHQLFVIVPSTLVRDATHALLVVGGSGWKPELEQPPVRSSMPSNSNVYARFAELAATPVAVLLQVPFQPLFDGLTEDWLIAHTFEQYLETGERDWPILLPMVKSAVRAMDAVQALMKDEWRMDIRTFTVTGASKRGWTTWLTGAVDPRATALAPMVIDVLNMKPQMDHARAVWGGPSPKVEPYTQHGLLDRLTSPEGQSLLEIVDPFSYRQVLAKPKLIINGTNDDYWPVDATRFYWNDLPGQKHLMFVPNTTHSLQDYSRVTAGVLALHQEQSQGLPMPKFEWQFEESEDAVTIVLEADPAPFRFLVWSAQRPTADFRRTHWKSAPLAAGDGRIRHTIPRNGEYQGMFVEAEFRQGRPLPLNLTTLVHLVPPAKGRQGSQAQ